MHYYQFNIADYRKDTGHLTPVEHYIYRWLIDEYHLSEQPFINNMPKLLRRMRLDESHRNSLEAILEEYFEPACDEDYDPVDLGMHPEYAYVGEYPELCQYWIHHRIEKDIDSYRKFIENKSAAGKASAKARKGKSNTCSTPVQHKPTGEQLTTNHKPITKEDSQRLFSDYDLEIANTIYSKILSIDSKAKKPNFNKWADDIRLMRERDNRTPEEIKSVFEFANKDAFWKSNILSPAKLRAKFTTLLAQKQRSGNKEDSKPFDPYENYL